LSLQGVGKGEVAGNTMKKKKIFFIPPPFIISNIFVIFVLDAGPLNGARRGPASRSQKNQKKKKNFI